MAEPHSMKAPSGVEQRPARLARHPVVLIAAVARNGVIGRDKRTPWNLPGDLAHFRRTTTGHPVVVGRQTFEAIGRPLPGRPTIVLSRMPGYAPSGVAVAGSLEEAFSLADREADAIAANAIMVAGGATLYAATIARADHLLLTMVDAAPAGDAVFPALDPHVWVEVERRQVPTTMGDTLSSTFTRWERRRI